MQITLSPVDAGSSPWRVLARSAQEHDGVAPFNEQTELDIASGRRALRLAREPGGFPAAVAVTGAGELDLVVEPRLRRRGVATAVLRVLLPTLPSTVRAWSHGSHAGAAALAGRFGFDAVRRLLRLTKDLSGPARPVQKGAGGGGIRIESFRAAEAAEQEAWVALNARIFRDHPEQGSVTLGDLHARMAEPWFAAADFLVARDGAGALVGYNWMKVEPGTDSGEIYVLGVAPEQAGRGVGRRLLATGLELLRRRGLGTALLYVEGDNAPALHLYRAAGFTDDVVDTQYQRRDPMT